MLSTLNKRSFSHNTCEDSLFVHEDDGFVQGVISDGCSTGIQSHFASQLICYIIKNHHNALTSNWFAIELMQNLKRVKQSLKLTEMHLLATCLLFYFDKEKRELEIRIFGDGYYYVNGQEYVIDQNNEPDYIGYHLEDASFLNYINKHQIRYHNNVTSFQICSDGIKSFGFSQFKEDTGLNPVEEMLSTPTSANYLERKFNVLSKKGFTISDDLSIISYVHD